MRVTFLVPGFCRAEVRVLKEYDIVKWSEVITILQGQQCDFWTDFLDNIICKC